MTLALYANFQVVSILKTFLKAINKLGWNRWCFSVEQTEPVDESYRGGS